MRKIGIVFILMSVLLACLYGCGGEETADKGVLVYKESFLDNAVI